MKEVSQLPKIEIFKKGVSVQLIKEAPNEIFIKNRLIMMKITTFFKITHLARDSIKLII